MKTVRDTNKKYLMGSRPSMAAIRLNKVEKAGYLHGVKTVQGHK